MTAGRWLLLEPAWARMLGAHSCPCRASLSQLSSPGPRREASEGCGIWCGWGVACLAPLQDPLILSRSSGGRLFIQDAAQPPTWLLEPVVWLPLPHIRFWAFATWVPLTGMPTSPSFSAFSFKTQLGSYLPSEDPDPLTGWGNPLEHGHPHHVPFLSPPPPQH